MADVLMQGGDLAVSVGGVYYFCDPASMETYDKKRQRLELATANRNNSVDFYDGSAECKVNIKKPLSDGDAALFTICGLGATIGIPTLTTAIFALPNRTVTVPSILCNDVTFTGETGKAWDFDANFLGTAEPVLSAGYTVRPTFQATPNYFYWKDLLTFFTAAAAGVTGAQKFTLKIEHNLDPFFGVRADGLALPTTYTPTEVYASGDLTTQMLGHADYDLYLAACSTTADIGLTARPFCPVTTMTLTLTCKAANYTMVKRDGAIKKAVMEPLSFWSEARGGLNQAVAMLAA